MGDPRPCLCQVPAASHPPSQDACWSFPCHQDTTFLLDGRLRLWQSQPRPLLLSGQGCSCPEGGIVLEPWDVDLSPTWSRAGFEAGPGMAWGQLKSLAELPPCHVFRVGGSFGMGE